MDKSITPMVRLGIGERGDRISLLTNHLKVTFRKTDVIIHQYTVSFKYKDTPVEPRNIGREIMKNIQQVLKGKLFAYDDGAGQLFTLGFLGQEELEFTVTIALNRKPTGSSADHKSPRRFKTYTMIIKYVGKIAMKTIVDALNGQDSKIFRVTMRVLNILLNQSAAQKECVSFRHSFFHNEARNFVNLSGGVRGWRGFHSCFRATQGGLSLNMNSSTTIIVQPGEVADFLLANQKVKSLDEIDWPKAERALKNLRIKASPTNLEFRIRGLTKETCRNQKFFFKQRGKEEFKMTVSDYFSKRLKIHLDYEDIPCISVGTPVNPIYMPVELCTLVPLQRYTKGLSNLQRGELVENCRQDSVGRMDVLEGALLGRNYDADPLLESCGISISTEFTRVRGRILPPPLLKVGGTTDFVPRDGRWNFYKKLFFKPENIERWALVNFSADSRMNKVDSRLNKLIDDIRYCGEQRGMRIRERPKIFIEEGTNRGSSPADRVDDMIKIIKSEFRHHQHPQLLLCVLPETKSDLYGPWKRSSLKHGFVTQCVSLTARMNNQYIGNLLLKINAKERILGGLNSVLDIERHAATSLVSKLPTLIVGMDVCHRSPGQDGPSIAAVVSSRKWPWISKYRAAVFPQSAKSEIIDSLFKQVSDKDDGIFRDLLMEFYRSTHGRKPEQIIIFRDGVSVSQFNLVLEVELKQIIEACQFFKDYSPKIMLVVAQKNHHTRFFKADSRKNVPPGTVIDEVVCDPKTNDFYMCAHAGMIGTTRPTHYHVLYDDIHFTPDQLQELVHSLSYVYQRSTTAISVVAPIYYAHLAAAQYFKMDEASASQGPSSLHERIENTMFFI